MEPNESKKRKLLRNPRIFVISCHGGAFTDPDPTKHGVPAEMEVKVETFTTAKFGRSISTYLFDEKLCFFDDAHTYYIKKILEKLKAQSSPPDKKALRAIITESLCYTRDQKKVFVTEDCRFKSHKVGNPILPRTMADMVIMCPGTSMNEAVLSIDIATKDVQDVHNQFGLKFIDDPFRVNPTPVSKQDNLTRMAFDIALETQHALGATGDTAELTRNGKIMRQAKRIVSGEVKQANYEYHTDHVDKYFTSEDYPYQLMKLSDVIKIAIDNGTIGPDDFLIIDACREFAGQLQHGHESPGRRTHYDSADDSAGGCKKKRTGTRTKNRNNRNNRNKNNKNNKTKHSANANNNTKKRKRKTTRRT
jgi:hypothetical protein